VASSRELSDTIGISADSARTISRIARGLLQIGFQTAEELFQQRKEIARITTGSKALDALLGGGVETKSVLELIGSYGAGKTQLCHNLCVTVQVPENKGGLNGSALFIDTEGTFRPERIMQMSEAMDIDSTKILKNILVARAFNSDHQILIVEKISDLLQKLNLKLIIVDSIISHFRSEYIGRENLPTRQQRLNKHLHILLRMAEIHNIAVVITNQVVASPDAFFGPPTKPAGGHILAHLSTNRVFLRKGKKNIRIARIIDSPDLPQSECLFLITSKGVEDS
jgi:DNA repair protein RadA